MKQNRKTALALTLAAMLLTLSGCTGVEDGTIDYVDGHWVFTEAQAGQSMDMTQLLANPDTFYAAASAMGDEELQRCFDLLAAGQSAALFKSLGEERAMALANRLTQPQVERLLTALQEQEKMQNPNDPAALAAIWPTLTTEEQLTALSGLSSEEYAALWALLDAASPTPEPEPAQPETTDAPDMTDPVYLAGIWHTLTRQEQSDVLGRLSIAHFVALWSLLDAQGSAASGETDPAPSDDGLDAQQTPEPQTPEESAELPSETGHDIESAQAQELLSAGPKPTPAEEDNLFIPTPKPTAKRTPAPTPAPTTLQDQLSQPSHGEADVPNNEAPAVEEKPDESGEESGDVSTPEEETPTEQPDAPDEMDRDTPTPEEETPAEQAEETTPAEEQDEPDETDGLTATELPPSSLHDAASLKMRAWVEPEDFALFC